MRKEQLEELEAYLRKPGMAEANPGLTSEIASSSPAPAKPHKYHAKPTEYNGRRYHSKKEAQYAQELDLRQKAGGVAFWLRQVPFDLPDGTRYFLDYMVFRVKVSGSWFIEFTEVKGFKTREGERKRKWCEKIYGIKVTVV